MGPMTYMRSVVNLNVVKYRWAVPAAIPLRVWMGHTAASVIRNARRDNRHWSDKIMSRCVGWCGLGYNEDLVNWKGTCG